MDDLNDWIRLTKTGASAQRLNRLLQHFGSPGALFAASPGEVAQAVGCAMAVAEKLLDPAYAANARDHRLMDRLHVRLLPRGSSEYPPLLAEIADPPPALYVRGTLTADATCVAIVGSRQASDYGKRMAEKFGRELAEAGVTVVSGMARGTDTSAHHGALRGGGETLACLGCGVDVCYPAENRELAARITQSGALLSEYPMTAPPDAWHFPSRNRVVSGLSLGVVVIESPARSGAMITAACATEQNRELFAVPGNIDNPRNSGPHALLRDGARLVETVDDILLELRLKTEHPQLSLPLDPVPPPELAGDEAKIYQILTPEPLPVDDIILESGLPAQSVTASLVMLEVKGIARRYPGNAYGRV